eukprot:1193411-Prorocentrum_minimum.AAC.2
MLALLREPTRRVNATPLASTLSLFPSADGRDAGAAAGAGARGGGGAGGARAAPTPAAHRRLPASAAAGDPPTARDQRAYSGGRNQSRGTREHILEVGTYRAGPESTK